MSKRIANLKRARAPQEAPAVDWKDLVESVFMSSPPQYDQSRIHLKNLIAKRGLKIIDVARAIGVHPRTFYRIVNGNGRKIENLPLWKCHKIATVLNISIDELLAVSLETREKFLEKLLESDGAASGL